MAKKSGLQGDEALCIKYLMDELDPAEVVQVEKKMESDPNFLIEVECLRRTMKRLDKLPVLSPPESVVDQICLKAREHREQTESTPFIYRLFHDARYASAAAILIIGVSAGSWFLFNSTTSEEGQVPSFRLQSSTMEGARAPQRQGAGTAGAWVDHNHVLSIQMVNSNGRSTNAVTDSSLLHSLHKLRALDNSSRSVTPAPEIELAREKR